MKTNKARLYEYFGNQSYISDTPPLQQCPETMIIMPIADKILKVKLMFPSSPSLLFSAVTLFCLSADLLRVLFFPIIPSHLYLSQFKNSANSHGNCTTKAIRNQYIKFTVLNTYKSLFCTISLLFQQAFKSFICNCSTIQLCTYP